MKTRIFSIILLLLYSSFTLFSFQNCSVSDSGGSNGVAASSLSDSDFNDKLLLLMINANVPYTSTTGAYATYNVRTVACGLDKETNKIDCSFVFSASQIYISNIPEAVEIETSLRARMAPSFTLNDENYVYIQNLNCTANVLNLKGTSCSYNKNVCATLPECIPGYQTPQDQITIPAPVVIDPYASTSSTTTIKTGSTVAFNPISFAQMSKYNPTHPLNNPTDIKINVNLAQAGQGRYGGSVSISYTDNGVRYTRDFKAGMGKNQSFSGMYDNNRYEADYNYWFNYDNQMTFSGFFEDQYGAITITLVPQTTPAGGSDAEPLISGPYRGYVYFKNFATTFAEHSPYRACWFTYTGPYDCRSNVIQTKSGLFPGSEASYEQLGTFSDIDVNIAFNIN